MNEINPAYAGGQLAKAFVTALSHEDEPTRRRAEARVDRWRRVLAGIDSGELTIGSRTPVADLPAWVTPEVVQGGFATGSAVAEGPLLPHELAVGADRAAVFRHYLSDDGLAELETRLEDGRYAVTAPEEAALLTVAWLVRAGHGAAALELLDVLRPYAGRLRFSPAPTDAPVADLTLVSRRTVGDVHDALVSWRGNVRLQTQYEALTVWNPYCDQLLALWLETVQDGRVAVVEPDGWRQRADALLRRYVWLAAGHPLSGKHRNPKQNQAILRLTLEDYRHDRLEARRRGLLQQAVDGMVRRRGVPGSEQHTALRQQQLAEAALPTYQQIARAVAGRLAPLRRDVGWTAGQAVDQPVVADQEATSAVLAGTPLPDPVHQKLLSARSGPIEELIALGIVPSAEVLAQLVPQLTAATTALAYRDESLQRLMAATYRAFRNRRSLLLLDLQHQVQLDELPWVRAVSSQRQPGEDTRAAARASLVRVAEAAVRGFPATILPNPLLQELTALARGAGIDLPLTEELAADIFMGTFSAKYLAAAKVAAGLLAGSPYERYYGIDYAEVLAIDDVAKQRRFFARTSDAFAALCQRRAGFSDAQWSVAANGTVIEQAQLLTTHNLAALVARLDLQADWAALSRRAFEGVELQVRRLGSGPRPLRKIKNAAYAWRQLVFFVSLCEPAERTDLLEWLRGELARQPATVVAQLEPVVAGLESVLRAGEPGAPFLGWTTGRHRMLLPT